MKLENLVHIFIKFGQKYSNEEKEKIRNLLPEAQEWDYSLC